MDIPGKQIYLQTLDHLWIAFNRDVTFQDELLFY